MAIDWLSAIDIMNNEVRVEEVDDKRAAIIAVDDDRVIVRVGGFNGMTAVETAEFDVRSVREAAGQLQVA